MSSNARPSFAPSEMLVPLAEVARRQARTATSSSCVAMALAALKAATNSSKGSAWCPSMYVQTTGAMEPRRV
jgi:hypothetical protein